MHMIAWFNGHLLFNFPFIRAAAQTETASFIISNDSSIFSSISDLSAFGQFSKSIDFLFPNVVRYRYSLVNGENGCNNISNCFNALAIIAYIANLLFFLDSSSSQSSGFVIGM